MKTLLRTTLASTALFGTAGPSFAAGAVHEDGSQLVVWVFLGMCALIVILQVLPLVIMGIGTLKAFVKGKAHRPEGPAPVVVDK